MNVLIDTSVWSVALRHSASVEGAERIKEQLYSLIEDSRVAIIGPIRQELLSGIKSKDQFNLLRKRLEPFRDLSLHTEDYILAAKFFNHCRAKGIQGSHVDFLICAVSSARKIPLFTADRDFERYSNYLDFSLYQKR
jgi:predicted nucleic acid-binding protein